MKNRNLPVTNDDPASSRKIFHFLYSTLIAVKFQIFALYMRPDCTDTSSRTINAGGDPSFQHNSGLFLLNKWQYRNLWRKVTFKLITFVVKFTYNYDIATYSVKINQSKMKIDV